MAAIGCVCGDKDSVRREIRGFLDGLARRHPGVAASILAALANVNPYTLFDPTLTRPGGDVAAWLPSPPPEEPIARGRALGL